MTPVDHSIEIKTAVATATTYVASGTLVLSDWAGFLGFLNEYAGAFGVMFIGLTYLTNLFFKVFDRRSWRRRVRSSAVDRKDFDGNR